MLPTPLLTLLLFCFRSARVGQYNGGDNGKVRVRAFQAGGLQALHLAI